MKFFRNVFSKKKTSNVQTMAVRARYDAAQTTPGNAAHWSMADFDSADCENNPPVRAILRSRSRYECSNNPWLYGILLTAADDIIGTGPRIQIESIHKQANEIERDFSSWARQIGLSRKLRTARLARIRDGEAFLVKVNNPKISGMVKLDYMLIDCDRVMSPYVNVVLDNKPLDVDGITFDRYGNPIKYSIAKFHPGGCNCAEYGFYDVKAADVIHLYRATRPEQHRGIPEITSALPLFALLRRYELATVQKMETSANISGVVFTDNYDIAPDNAVQLAGSEDIVINRDSFVSLPPGWKLQQFTNLNPTDSQNDFSLMVKTEVARCLNMPKNIALGDSSGYNYASGRLDFQSYDKYIDVERSDIELECLDRIFAAWFEEYAPGEILPAHYWFWDGREHVDPLKNAEAQKIRLESGTATYAAEYAKDGKDWQVEFEQLKREQDYAKSLGLTLPGFPSSSSAGQAQASLNKYGDGDE